MNTNKDQFTTWFHELSESELLEAYKQDIALYESKEQQEEYDLADFKDFKNLKGGDHLEDYFQRIFNPEKSKV